MKHLVITAGLVLALATGALALQQGSLGPVNTVVTGATILTDAVRVDTLFTLCNTDGDTLMPSAALQPRSPYIAVTAYGTSASASAATKADSGWAVTVKALRAATFTAAASGSYPSVSTASGIVSNLPTVICDSLIYMPAFPTTRASAVGSTTFILRNTADAFIIYTENRAGLSLTGFGLQWQEWREER